jgi:peptide/nickel transport system ATP-binding protein
VNNLLEIKDLHVEFRTMEGTVYALKGVNLELKKGEALGLVGETGAGKSTTAFSIMGLLPKKSARIPKGSIMWGDKDLLDKHNEKYVKKIRGDRISMVFQNPLTSLNPVFTIGEQVAMVFRRHQGMNEKEAYEAAGKMLQMVGILPERMIDYPHQFSGGMRQRVGIAAAIACKPDLLIADEPTTALDVTIQAQVLELMKGLQEQVETSLIMITHNLGIVKELCQKVAVMYAGAIIELGTVDEVFRKPSHPYTLGLMGSLPDIKKKTERLTPIYGFMPNPMEKTVGCSFAPRCPKCMEICRQQAPGDIHLNSEHTVACFLAREGIANE